LWGVVGSYVDFIGFLVQIFAETFLPVTKAKIA